MKGMLKLGLVLGLYALAACVGLAFVYNATRERIEGHEQQNLEAALKELFPEADGFDDITGAIESPGGGIGFDREYKVFRGNEIIGVAIRALGPSYGGPLTLLAGVKQNGTVGGIKILEHKDTPGLGAKATNIAFYGQFAGKSVRDPFEAKNDVQAITASTITSRSVANIVKAAARSADAWLAKNAGGGAR